jgi:hypothetical protein
MFSIVTLAACALLAIPTATHGLGDESPSPSELRSLLVQEAIALTDLADTLQAAGEIVAAERTRTLVPIAQAKEWERFEPLPDVVPARAGLASLPPRGAESQAESIRAHTAQSCFEIATRAASGSSRRLGLADSCLRAVLARDPNHAEARRLLGFLPYEGGWATPHAAEQLKSGKVSHRVFGWVPKKWVEHLDGGELPGTTFRGDQPTQWLPAAEADALRADFQQRPWVITTHHFEIRTNVPLNEAIEFGRKLEALHELFFALMADVVGRERLPLAQRFANPKLAPKTTPKRMKVWYFAERAEYLDYFQKQFQRNEAVSLGYYMPPAEARGFNVEPRSYFYRDTRNPIDATSTLFHEASHQLLFESAGATQFPRNQGHFWVWEGLGTYFETARLSDDGTITIGGVVGPRMREARIRLVDRGELVPLDQLVNLDRDRFLREPEVYLHYAESMALAVYLMHGEEGALRQNFLDYVRAAYDGRFATRKNIETSLNIKADVLEFGLLQYLNSNNSPPTQKP